MANPKPTRPHFPKPPDDLDGEALLEWHRIVEELDESNLLSTADRAIMTHHCRTWATIALVSGFVAVDGPIILQPNKWPGFSKEFEAQQSLTKLDASLLAQLGLTPAARTKLTPKQTEDNSDKPLTF